MCRMSETVWLLLACKAVRTAAQSDNDRKVVAIVVTAIGVTAVIIVGIVCVGCIYYIRAVKKKRTKVWMRERINCQNRSNIITTPDNLIILDNYFMEHGFEVDTLFNEAIEENWEPQQAEETKRDGLNLDKLFTTESERRRVSTLLHVPDKVKQLYEERTGTDMYETNGEVTDIGNEKQGESNPKQKSNSAVLGVKIQQTLGETAEEVYKNEFIYTDLKEKQNDTTFEWKSNKAETGDNLKKENGEGKIKDNDNTAVGLYPDIDSNNRPQASVSKRKKTAFLSLPDIDKFFNLTAAGHDSKKKKQKSLKARRINRNKISYLRKYLKALNQDHFKKHGEKSTSNVRRKHTQRSKSKASITKEYGKKNRRNISSDVGPM